MLKLTPILLKFIYIINFVYLCKNTLIIQKVYEILGGIYENLCLCHLQKRRKIC